MTKPTNIVLEGNRFIVYVTLPNGMAEENTFLPHETADDISRWIDGRVQYYADLEAKLEQLKAELM